MFYKEIPPVTPLRPYVDRYAVLYDEKIYQDYHAEKIPLSISKGLVFYFTPERPVISGIGPASKWLPTGVILPQTNRSNTFKYKKRMDSFIVGFEPGKFRWLFPFSAFEFMNDMPAFEGASDKPLLDYYHQIILAKSIGERVDISNEHLLKRVDLMDGKNDMVQEALKWIYTDLRLNMTSISKRLGVTGRHFRRVFSSEMGMQPKHYQKLVRISDALNKLDKFKKGNTTDIAYECGFFDQSHFISTFKEFTGITPIQYLNKNKTKYFVEKLKKKMVFEKNSLRMSVFSYFS